MGQAVPASGRWHSHGNPNQAEPGEAFVWRSRTSFNSGSNSWSFWGLPRSGDAPKTLGVSTDPRPRVIKSLPMGTQEPCGRWHRCLTSLVGSTVQAGTQVHICPEDCSEPPFPAMSVCPSCRPAVVCYQAVPAAGMELGQKWPSPRPQS